MYVPSSCGIFELQLLRTLCDFSSFCYSGSPSHPSMMGGPMPVRGPAQGPRGTGAGMRGQMGRGDYG